MGKGNGKLKQPDRPTGIGGTDAIRITEGTWKDLWLEKIGKVERKDLSSVLPVQLGIFTEEFNNDNYLKNDLNRCFYCKFELYEKLEEILIKENFSVVFNGTNFDDLSDIRPGIDAAKKKNIVSPLVKCKINKNEIRQIAKELGLPNWDKPAQPCLSSRVPHGVKINMDILKRIEEAENYLSDLGFVNFRVRIHGDLAKIEAQENDFEKFNDYEIRKNIVNNFKSFGFKFVSLDLMFFKSGNLSRAHESKK